LAELVSNADRDLTRAAGTHETLQDDIKKLVVEFKEVYTLNLFKSFMPTLEISGQQILKKLELNFKTLSGNVS
jgi:hypothetical protein